MEPHQWNIKSHDAADLHILEAHAIGHQTKSEYFFDMTPGEILMELRVTGECTHHVEGFDTDNKGEANA